MKLIALCASAFALAAIGIAHAQPVQVTKTECAYTDGATMDAMRTMPAQATSASGYAVHAARGVMTCSPRAAGKTVCQAKASKILIVLQTDFWFVTIPNGKTATVTVSETAQPTCFLNK